MRSSTLVAMAASLSAANAVFQGFNYGATKTDGSFMYEADFEAKFKNAKELVGTSGGFTSARLYTMIQGGSSTNEPTQAIQAAINQDVSLLLGLWASGGEGGIQAEITALKSAIAQYGTAFTKLVAGISVGSEDLYRISPTGIAAKSGYGANPDELVHYISEVRSAIEGTALSGASIGHVDTWTAWVNGSNSAVASAVDWVGMDAYPYFQNTMTNDITVGKGLFNDALSATQAAVGGKPVWITETGWPVSGPNQNGAVANTANAKTYWDEVGCPLFGNVNTWWFTQQDADPSTPSPSFGLVGSTLSTTPLYDLSCDAVSSSSSSAASSSTAVSSSGAASSASASVLASASASSSGSDSSGSGVTSSVASSIIASLSSEATGTTPLVTGGSGLSPSQVAPSYIASAVPTGSIGSGSSGSGSGSSGNGTALSTTATLATSKTGATSTSTSTSSPSTISSNAAVGLSGSFIGAIGAVIAAIIALN